MGLSTLSTSGLSTLGALAAGVPGAPHPMVGDDTGLRWPWLVLALAVVVLVLLVLSALWPGRTPSSAAYVAHAARLQALPRYRALLRRRVVIGACASLAALVAVSGAIVLAGRVQERQATSVDDRSRDIMLCLDASGSMAEVDAAVLREFRTIVDGLQGERVGLTIWSGVAINIFPLTDDYDFVVERLTEAEAAFGAGGIYSDEYALYTAGTVVDWGVQSQLGDGLASCVQRFDRREEERSRAIVLASDNEPIGEGIYDVTSAAGLAVERDVVVHGIAAPATAERPSALRQFEEAVRSTSGTFSLLGEDGSAAAVVEAIGQLEATPIDRPPLVQVRDRPELGITLAGIGIGGLLLVWLVEGVLALRARRPGGQR
ncbi:VWA domain-containing protein [Nocardioides sp. zg-536]|uniref:VWA domain-containing protein n=1 Tax=Nocardioides faecalis TaxID=2803858 RepID=A0A938Y563_9ACTN|nr:VWA domain-containing protein [Nocardioides faecalis]MBM9459419.1 VWA domain-containing protein [Nocardioides faecalis]QVI59474.1 VWA domain-containing protein [Nocardioides faecalis]